MAFAPVIAPYLAMGASVLAGGVQAYSQIQQGKIADSTARYNAKAKEIAADQADLEAREQIARIRAQNREQISARRASIASSGVVGFTGSPLAILGEEAGRLELAAQDRARAAELTRRRGFADAAMTRLEGKLAKRGANLAAAGTILSTVGKTAGAYSDYKYQGVI